MVSTTLVASEESIMLCIIEAVSNAEPSLLVMLAAKDSCDIVSDTDEKPDKTKLVVEGNLQKGELSWSEVVLVGALCE